ncbi:MAG: hypothetical protein WDN69_12595 [Aliidongia sp.]
MARHPVPQSDPPAGGLTERSQRVKNSMLLLSVLGMVALAIFEQPIAILLSVALIPTMAAWIVDDGARQQLLRTVAPLNFACALPFALQLWYGKNSSDRALQLLVNPYVLLALFGGALFGWMLYWAAPRIMAAVVARRIERQRRHVLQRQAQLIDEWGDEVKIAP